MFDIAGRIVTEVASLSPEVARGEMSQQGFEGEEPRVGLLSRFSRRKAGGSGKTSTQDAQYLANWAKTHTGVEAYVEPKTTVTDVTAVLIAVDGEWTRRIVGERGAQKLAEDLGIPVYDVWKTGYPQRMRDYDARKKIERRRQAEGS